jgi:hypothetical protein
VRMVDTLSHGVTLNRGQRHLRGNPVVGQP